MRDLYLRMAILIGIAGLAITELLSVFGAIRRIPLLVCWILVAVVLVLYARSKRVAFAIKRPDPVVTLCGLGIVAILALTGVTAAYSPPNSWDALAYHMPRVVYWAEQGSVRFFPTPYLNQIQMPPFAEYFMLHSYVLSGGDHLVNFVQWFGSLGSVVGVSLIAGFLGAGPRGQAIAALFCATIPSGVLAASGAKNDYFLAMWLVAAIYFAARGETVFLGAALGLALLTKATAYLFAPWILAAVLLPRARSLKGPAIALGIALCLNAPHYLRNLELSGSLLGVDSAHGDGVFRWRNETFGWKQTASNILRNTSEQLGGRSEKWNQAVYDWTVRAHQALGISVNDPATTWRYAAFAPPRNTNHEADANSKWHILIFWIAAGIVAWRAKRTRNIEQILYALAILCGFVAFCAYLKWQAYEARLFLPLLVAGAPIVGFALDRAVSSYLRLGVQIALCIFLLSTARRPALENWLRPLKGERSVFLVPRDDQYFVDMAQSSDVAVYKQTVESLTKQSCSLIGMDATSFPLEYPLMALLKEAKPATRFVHTGVHNASSKFRPSVERTPCVVVSLAQNAQNISTPK